MDYKEKVIALLNSQELSKEQKEKLEVIFPELKESEDEKIRKWIIENIQETLDVNGFFENQKIMAKKALSWLEKQGEQKPANKIEPKFKIGQTIKKECFNLGFTIVKIEDGFYYNNMGDHFPFTDQDNWELIEQKPAWSEEDEEQFCFCCAAIELSSYSNDEHRNYAISFLESLKGRVQPQQEWSDVDRSILFRTIDDLKFLRDAISKDPEYAVNIIDIEREITWLKSLRPQNRWKPSDEQMLAINTAINVFGKGTINGKYLIELQEQLKKLKE